MIKNIIKKRIVAVLAVCAIALAGILLQKILNKQNPTMTDKIILVSAHYDYQDQQAPGKMTFALLDIGSDVKLSKINKAIDIGNREKNYSHRIDNYGKPLVRNLLKAHKTNRYYACSSNFIICIQFDEKTGKLLTYSINGGISDFDDYATDVDYREENILLNSGELSCFKRPKFFFDSFIQIPEAKEILRLKQSSLPLDNAVNSRFIDENSAVLIKQTMDCNYYVIITSANQSECQYLQFKYSPSSYYNNSFFYPIDISADRKKLAFLALDANATSNREDLWLYIWNIQGNKIIKSIKLLNKNEYQADDFRPNHLQWNPVDANLILFYSRARVEQSSLFSIDSFTDWQTLVQCLKNNKSPDIERVRSFLNAKTLEKITEWKPDTLVDESLKNLIIEDFNHILGRSDFYKPEIFRDIEIGEYDRLQVNTEFKNSSQEDIIIFNGGVFDQIFFSHLPYQYFDLINLNDKSKTRLNIHHELGSMVKNFRWSPDGKKIGIIDYNGRLYIYDLEKKTTKKVSEDPDCFDFFWVE